MAQEMDAVSTFKERDGLRDDTYVRIIDGFA